MTTVKQIVENHLREIGADGLISTTIPTCGKRHCSCWGAIGYLPSSLMFCTRESVVYCWHWHPEPIDEKEGKDGSV